jgi:CheY-like chemotaxis protein
VASEDFTDALLGRFQQVRQGDKMYANLNTDGDYKTPSILLVEDDPITAVDLSILLCAEGYSVCGPTSSFDEAFNLLEQHKPDAAVVDISSREPSFTSFAAALSHMKIPAIMASRTKDASVSGRPCYAEATYIPIPANPGRLIQALDELLEEQGWYWPCQCQHIPT